jgi:hypothetical protein
LISGVRQGGHHVLSLFPSSIKEPEANPEAVRTADSYQDEGMDGPIPYYTALAPFDHKTNFDTGPD